MKRRLNLFFPLRSLILWLPLARVWLTTRQRQGNILRAFQPPHYKARSEEGAPTARSQLGQRIRVLRETLSLTQEQLAEKAGISVSYLSMIERVQRTPYVETLVSVAAALGITVSQLFLDVNEPRGSGPAPDLPLMAYLGTRRLDRKELDALLKVARAMFDGKP